MFESKIIAHLACMYLFLFGCLCFKIQKDPVKTEHMVQEFLQKRNKTSFFKAPWKMLSTRGYICSHSHRFLAYLCAVILQQNPYNEIIDSTRYTWAGCAKRYISSRVRIIGQTKSDQIRLFECPSVNGPRYYLSRTHIKSSLFVYVSNDQGFHIHPDAFVSDIDMGAIKKNYEKSKVLKKKRETILEQYKPHPPPRSAEEELRILIHERMILIFSKFPLQKAILFQYLNFQNQKWTYSKFQIHYNKINVCSLRLQQQIYLCKQVLDNSHYIFEIDSTHYRKNDCRKRKIPYENWRIVNPISTLMCPPTYSPKKGGLERIYNWQSYFLSSGPDQTSVIIFERSYDEHYIKAMELVSSFHTDKLAEVLKIERSQPWTNPISSELDTESQFPLSVTSSPDRQSTTSSIFSTSSPDRISSKSTFSSASSPDRSSQSSFYGVSSPDRSPVSTPFSGTIAPRRKSSLLPFHRTPSPDNRSAFRAMHVNHDRYVAEEETVKFSRFKSIKNPYERFRLTYSTNNICNFKAKLRVQLCKEILEGPEFGYQLVTTNTDNTSCKRRSIAVNLQDSEDLFSNKVSLMQCPSVEAFDSVYYLSSSGQQRSAILFRRLGVFELTYPEVYISSVDKEDLEHKTSPKISPSSSPLRNLYSFIRS